MFVWPDHTLKPLAIFIDIATRYTIGIGNTL